MPSTVNRSPWRTTSRTSGSSTHPRDIHHAGRAEADALAARRARGQRRRRVDRDHATVVQKGEAIAEALRLLHEMGDEDDRHSLVADPLDQLPRLAARLRIQAGGELVEDGQLRATDERQRDRQPLALAAGQVGEAIVALGLEPEQLEQPLRVGGIAVEGGEQLKRLPHAQLVGELGGLELDPDPLAELLRSCTASRPSTLIDAAVGPAQAADGFHGRRLAGAVGSEDAEDLASVDRERDVVDGERVAVAHAEMVDGHDHIGGGLCPGLFECGGHVNRVPPQRPPYIACPAAIRGRRG